MWIKQQQTIWEWFYTTYQNGDLMWGDGAFMAYGMVLPCHDVQGHGRFRGAQNAQARAQQIGGLAHCCAAHVAAATGSWAHGGFCGCNMGISWVHMLEVGSWELWNNMYFSWSFESLSDVFFFFFFWWCSFCWALVDLWRIWMVTRIHDLTGKIDAGKLWVIIILGMEWNGSVSVNLRCRKGGCPNLSKHQTPLVLVHRKGPQFLEDKTGGHSSCAPLMQSGNLWTPWGPETDHLEQLAVAPILGDGQHWQLIQLARSIDVLNGLARGSWTCFAFNTVQRSITNVDDDNQSEFPHHQVPGPLFLPNIGKHIIQSTIKHGLLEHSPSDIFCSQKRCQGMRDFRPWPSWLSPYFPTIFSW